MASLGDSIGLLICQSNSLVHQGYTLICIYLLKFLLNNDLVWCRVLSLYLPWLLSVWCKTFVVTIVENQDQHIFDSVI